MRQKIRQIMGMLSSIDMTTGTPWKKLLVFTIPMVLGNLFQQMYGIVDMIILGHFVGDDALAAVGSTIPLFFLLLVLMIGVATGAGIMVSQYFGANRHDELSFTIGTCLTLATVLGVLMMIIAPFFTRPMLILLDTPPEILDDAVTFINIQLWGILGFMYFNIIAGILRGLGDSLWPLVFLALASVLNIVLDIVFIPIMGMGVAGAALATIVVQFIASILCMIRLMQMRNIFDFKLHHLRPKRRYALQLLKLGLPTGAQQGIFAVAMMIVQPLVNGFGPLLIATNVIIMRIDGFVMMPNFSFGNTMTVFTGQNIGARKLDRVKQGTKEGAIMAMGTAFVLVILILIFGRHVAGAFTDTQEVIDLSVQMIRILAVGYVIFALNMIVWGVIRGAGDAITPLWTAFVSTALIRVPSAYLFVHLMGEPEALYYSLLLGWIVITIFGLIAYRVGNWRTKGIVS